MLINADAKRLFKAEHPRTIIVLDAEVRYEHDAHRRYQASERWRPEDVATLDRREARSDRGLRHAGRASRSSQCLGWS